MQTWIQETYFRHMRAFHNLESLIDECRLLIYKVGSH